MICLFLKKPHTIQCEFIKYIYINVEKSHTKMNGVCVKRYCILVKKLSIQLLFFKSAITRPHSAIP